MSELLNRIKKDQLQARKDKDTFKSTVLTTLIGEASPSGTEQTNDEKVMKVVEKFVKNNREMKHMVSYSKDDDKVAEIDREIEILSEYLPEQLSEEELESLVVDFLKENDVNSPKQMGMVMGHFNKTYKGQFDGKTLSMIVKDKLSG